jgi:hypothetical protein
MAGGAGSPGDIGGTKAQYICALFLFRVWPARSGEGPVFL